MADVAHARRSPEELAHGFEPTAQLIRNWVAQACAQCRFVSDYHANADLQRQC
jgi:hypothetical protein